MNQYYNTPEFKKELEEAKQHVNSLNVLSKTYLLLNTMVMMSPVGYYINKEKYEALKLLYNDYKLDNIKI